MLLQTLAGTTHACHVQSWCLCAYLGPCPSQTRHLVRKLPGPNPSYPHPATLDSLTQRTHQPHCDLHPVACAEPSGLSRCLAYCLGLLAPLPATAATTHSNTITLHTCARGKHFYQPFLLGVARHSSPLPWLLRPLPLMSPNPPVATPLSPGPEPECLMPSAPLPSSASPHRPPSRPPPPSPREQPTCQPPCASLCQLPLKPPARAPTSPTSAALHTPHPTASHPSPRSRTTVPPTPWPPWRLSAHDHKLPPTH